MPPAQGPAEERNDQGPAQGQGSTEHRDIEAMLGAGSVAGSSTGDVTVRRRAATKRAPPAEAAGIEAVEKTALPNHDGSVLVALPQTATDLNLDTVHMTCLRARAVHQKLLALDPSMWPTLLRTTSALREALASDMPVRFISRSRC